MSQIKIKNRYDGKIVYTYGAFDLLHPGHIKLLERAKMLGDYLIVGVVDDGAIRRLKGDDRPIQSQKDRLYIIGHLDMVDKTMPQTGYDPSNNLRKLHKVTILTKGDDWDYIPGAETIEKLGGKLIKLSYSKGFSTSSMIGRMK